MYLSREELILPRHDLEGNPTQDNYYHTLPCPNGTHSLCGFMGDDTQGEFFYNLGFFTRGYAVEIGSYMGYSTALFGLGMKHSPWQQGKLVCVDIWEDDYLGSKKLEQTFKENIAAFGLEEYIIPRKFWSRDEEAISWLKEPLEWVYFDASHVWKELVEDFDVYYPRVKKGGLLIWHDTHQTDPPKVIAHYQEKFGILPVITHRPDYQVWMKPL